RALSHAVSDERASSDPDSVLVRLLAPTAEVLLVSAPSSWPQFEFDRSATSPGAGGAKWHLVPSTSQQATLEMVSQLLSDGTIIEVGRTTIARERMLGDVRNAFGLLVVVIVAVGLAGGVALTHQALRPLHDLRDAVRTVARTGQLRTRVLTRPGGDIVDEL